jgi:thiol-disulfide isomerase/thioredoxin
MRAIAIVLMLFGFSASSFSQGQKQQEKAVDFVLWSLTNSPVRLSQYKGKVVLLNFWATWCAPCKAEMPEMVRWQERHKKQGLEIIGITYPPYKKSQVLRIAKRLKINYPIGFANRKLAQAYAVGEILPVTIIIDRRGNIVERLLGVMDEEEFEQKIKPLLD